MKVYCSIIWASTYSSHLRPLFRLQKKALRIITHSPPRAHTYHIPNTQHIYYKYQVSCFLFLHMQKFLPFSLSSLFVLTLIVINISPRKKTTYIFILTYILFLFGYRVLKFGMTFLSHFVIHLLFLIINIK